MMYEPRQTVVHRSLQEIKTVGGVEDRLAILNGVITLAIMMGMRIYIYLVVGICLHYVMRYITRRDPYTRRIYMRYNRQWDAYDPWPHKKQLNHIRPEGCGKGMLC
jgi:type IV secretion system protein TrbD